MCLTGTRHLAHQSLPSHPLQTWALSPKQICSYLPSEDNPSIHLYLQSVRMAAHLPDNL